MSDKISVKEADYSEFNKGKEENGELSLKEKILDKKESKGKSSFKKKMFITSLSIIFVMLIGVSFFYGESIRNEILLSSSDKIPFEQSKIIKSKEESDLIRSWIAEKMNITGTELVFKATRDGDNSESFFSKCQKIGPTLSLFLTTDGARFGGFSSVNWDLDKYEQSDKNAFLFSIDKKTKYPATKVHKAIISRKGALQIFGNTGFCDGLIIDEECLTKSRCFESKNDREETITYDLHNSSLFSTKLYGHK